MTLPSARDGEPRHVGALRQPGGPPEAPVPHQRIPLAEPAPGCQEEVQVEGRAGRGGGWKKKIISS